MAENTTLTLTKYAGNSGSVTGSVVFDGTSITATDYIEVDLGFQPRYVEYWNATDRICGRHFKGMADNSALKTAANGTQTLEVTGGNGGITLTTRGFRVLQNATLGLIAASKTCYFVAEP